jgi:Tol biopolymer transport system component
LQDGSELAAVAPAADTYALSPDSRTLAVVYASTDQLPPGCSAGAVVLWDVKRRTARCTGSQAIPLGLSWSPDSRSIAYTASSTAGPVVKRTRTRGSSAERTLGVGVSPMVSPDGRRIVYSLSEQPGPSDLLRLQRATSGSAAKVRSSAGALGYGWSSGGALYLTRPSEGDAWALVKTRRDGTGAETLGTYVPEPPAYALTAVNVSPSGKKVLLAATGDDDYSRLVVFDRTSEHFSAVPTRRDAYPCSWGAKGSVLFFEGNAYQGEPSSLVSMMPDGTGKVIVVVGAAR